MIIVCFVLLLIMFGCFASGHTILGIVSIVPSIVGIILYSSMENNEEQKTKDEVIQERRQDIKSECMRVKNTGEFKTQIKNAKSR